MVRQTLRQHRGRPRGRGLACRAWEQSEKVGRREKRDRGKTRCKMSSLLADICWSNSKIQTTLVIPVSTDLNVHTLTVLFLEDRHHLYAASFLETIPAHSSSSFFPSSVILYSSSKLNLTCQKRPSFILQ